MSIWRPRTAGTRGTRFFPAPAETVHETHGDSRSGLVCGAFDRRAWGWAELCHSRDADTRLFPCCGFELPLFLPLGGTFGGAHQRCPPALALLGRQAKQPASHHKSAGDSRHQCGLGRNHIQRAAWVSITLCPTLPLEARDLAFEFGDTPLIQRRLRRHRSRNLEPLKLLWPRALYI